MREKELPDSLGLKVSLERERALAQDFVPLAARGFKETAHDAVNLQALGGAGAGKSSLNCNIEALNHKRRVTVDLNECEPTEYCPNGPDRMLWLADGAGAKRVGPE